jgi:hypothetical protein
MRIVACDPCHADEASRISLLPYLLSIPFPQSSIHTRIPIPCLCFPIPVLFPAQSHRCRTLKYTFKKADTVSP